MTTAIASFLHARQASGEWLVRIEDIDPPREAPGAADSILRVLDTLGLAWDRPVLYQSTRLDEYAAVAQSLLDGGQAFHCSCSRREVRALAGASGIYPGTCRRGQARPGPTALRVCADGEPVEINDRLQGASRRSVAESEGDYVIVRRDCLPAYHLAVVVDDAHQGVTDVVRGIDLLDSTFIHVHLQWRLNLPRPDYWHLPVVANASGQKLSKQRGAVGIPPEQARTAAIEALGLLGLRAPPELVGPDLRDLWKWAAEHWDISRLAGRRLLSGGRDPPPPP